MSAPSTAVTTHTIDAPGVTLHYEVRGTGPLLVIVGAPMAASYFGPLADALADTFTVVTTDPRGIGHSVLDDPDRDSLPTDRADDLHRILTALDRGPAHVFGSSGGAVTAIALAERHPADVRTVVAHEPPLPMLLEDRDELLAGAEDIRTTFLRDGPGPAWGKFMVLTGFPMPDPVEEPETDPVPDDPQAEADGASMLGHMLVPGLRWEPDLAAIRATGTRIVVGVGEGSAGQLCARTSAAVADGLGVDVTGFPGDHRGFLGVPEPFERRLRDLLG